MLVEQLATTYKCYSSIGNSLVLEYMLKEVLRTFVSETYAVYAVYYDEDKNKVCSFGKIDHFNIDQFKGLEKNRVSLIKDFDRNTAVITLEQGAIYLVTKNLGADCNFFISMFQSFIQKLNLSISACLNVRKIEESNKLLQKQKQELIFANKARDSFLANMSHELKTPLNSINVISDVMLRNRTGNLDDKQLKNLEIVNKCGKDLLFLINDILDISKLEAGELRLNIVPFNIKHLMNSIYDMFVEQIKEKELDFEYKIDDTLEIMKSDQDRLKQIIKNLLSNALKFTHSGKIRFFVLDSGEDIKVVVKDDGIGIPLDKLHTIFDRFKQVDDSTTRKYGGTGLGLAITKDLVELLNGNIRVNSQVNKGSTFEVILKKDISIKTDKKFEEIDIEQSTLKFNLNEPLGSIIYVYNNDPIYFMKIFTKLRDKYDLKQIYELESFKNNEHKLIIYLDKLNDNDKRIIVENNISNIIALGDKDLGKTLSDRISFYLNLED